MKLSFVRSEDHHVVNVSHILLRFQLLLNEMIEPFEVIVREPLRRIKPERESFPIQVAVEINDFACQVVESIVADILPEHFLQSLTIDGSVEVPDV